MEQLESVDRMDQDDNLVEETFSDQSSIPDDSSDIINYVCGDPQMEPRVGDKYQVKIPPMITESERLQLLANPLDSETKPNVSHLFLIGLEVKVMSICNKVKRKNEGRRLPNVPDDTVDINESLKSIKNKRNRIRVKDKRSKLDLERLDSRIVEKETEANPRKLDKNNIGPRKTRERLVPGSLGNRWTDFEVESFLLGLYIFGKDFVQVQKFMENKRLGEILLFYYGDFFMSDKYRRWSDSRKTRSRKCKYGRKIFSGWRQHKLLTRLLPHLEEDLKPNVLEVSKSFAEGNTSFENYISCLKTAVGIQTLVEAVGIGKGKEDLTSLSMEPIKTQVFPICPEVPTGKACSSLTSGDIIKLLTGGFRLSKARCNDIFWEAVWPRLLARGWRSEQPKGYICSNDYLVFLVPDVKKFSRRKLVKGDHYFDSVSDILKRVAAKPELLELDNEEARGDKENGWVPEVSSDLDDSSGCKPRHYLKPRVSSCNSELMKFTVVDTSLMNGGKSSKVRELRCAPVDLMISSKVIHGESEVCFSKDSPHKYKVEKSNKDVGRDEGRINRVGRDNTRYTIVDTSSFHGKSKVWELRSSPVLFSHEINRLSSQNVGKLSSRSPDEHVGSNAIVESVKLKVDASDARLDGQQDTADPKRNDGQSVADMLLDGDRNDINPNASKGVSDSVDSSKHVELDLFPGKSISESCRDQKSDKVDDEKQGKKIIKHQFSRRVKSGHSVNVAPVTKRRRLTACVKSEINRRSENLSVNVESKQKTPCCSGLNIPNTKNGVAVPEEGGGVSPAEGDCAMDVDTGNSFATTIPRGNQETSIDLNLNQVPLDESDDGPSKTEVEEDIPGINSNGSCSSIDVNNKPQPEATSISVDATEEQQPSINPRRQSTRNRPLTTRALEAFESGFFTKKKRKPSELKKEIILFSCPSRKARSKLRLNPRANAGTVDTETKVEKEADGAAFVVQKDSDDTGPLNRMKDNWFTSY